MPLSEPPARLPEQIICSISAAAKFEIPANIVLAVAEKEGGRPGQWVRNSNGTYDVGAMQFNTSYLSELARYGITANHVAGAGCYAFELAAWRIRRHIRNDSGDVWTRVANYHSRTIRYNAVYRADLIKRANRWADWLSIHFATYDLAYLGEPPRAVSALGIAPVTRPVERVGAKSGAVSAYVPRQIVGRK